MKPPMELALGASEHYEDAVYYDHTYRTRTEDIGYYRRVVKQHGTRVLEVGGGSGRVSIPLVQDGADVTVLDASRAMLQRAEERADEELSASERKRLHTHEGDMRTFALGRTFDLVIAPFNVMQHLYEPVDFQQCFARVREHLAPKGLFVFDVRMPVLRELVRDPHRWYRVRPFVHPGLGCKVGYAEQFQYDPIKQVQSVTMRFEPESSGRRKAKPFDVLLTHRVIFPNEMRALLALGGLRLRARHGDFTGRPLEADDEQQIIHASAIEAT